MKEYYRRIARCYGNDSYWREKRRAKKMMDELMSGRHHRRLTLTKKLPMRWKWRRTVCGHIRVMPLIHIMSTMPASYPRISSVAIFRQCKDSRWRGIAGSVWEKGTEAVPLVGWGRVWEFGAKLERATSVDIVVRYLLSKVYYIFKMG